jgi:hypothetical protein
LKNKIDLDRLVREAKEHRLLTGDPKYWVNPETMTKLLLLREAVVISHIQQGGLLYVEVILRGERFVTAAERDFFKYEGHN